MSLQDNLIDVGLEVALDVAGQDATYHRWDAATEAWQDLPIVAIRGSTRFEDVELTRDPSQAILNTIEWRMRINQLADLVDATAGIPDWIEDGLGDRYTVVRTEGDRNWVYVTDDQTWVRIRTFPDE